jgi:hypothetical protein
MRGRLGAPLLIAVLGLVFFADLVAHPTKTLYSDYSDLLTLHLPSRRFLVEAWQETGQLPLWCPYNFAGLPCVHDIQVSAFYPPHLPLLLLPPEHLGAALSWLVVLHVVLAGWCMYAYARSRGLQDPGALVAAVGYMFAGKWLLHLLAGGHYNMVPLAWLPLVLLGLEQAIRWRRLLPATWAGVVFGFVVLGAYPYVSLYAGLFVALWSLGTALEEAGYLEGIGPRSRRRSLAALLWWAGMGCCTALVAVAVGAVQLLPGMEFAGEASRSAGVSVSPQLLQDGFRSLAGLVGPALVEEPNGWENRAALGVLWLALVLMSPLLGGRRVRFEAGVCLVLLGFVVCGAAVFQWLPGFRLFRMPSRMYLVAALPAALLAGRTVQALVAAPGLDPDLRRRCRRILLQVAGVVLLLAVLFTVLVPLWHPDMRVRFHPYWATLLLTIPGAWWLLGRRSAWSAPAAVVLCLLDVATLSWPLVAVRPEDELYAPSECVRYLASRRGEYGRVLDVNPSSPPTAANHTPLWPGLPAVERVEPVRGFNPIDILRYKEFLEFIADDDRPLSPLDGMFTGPIVGTFPIRNQSLADLLGIRFLLLPADQPLEATAQTDRPHDTWTPVADDPRPVGFNFIPVTPSCRDCGLHALPPYRVYENRQALPRAFVVPEAQPLPDRAAVLPALKSTDFRRRVLLEDFRPPREEPAASAVMSFRAAAVREYRPNRVSIEVDGPGPGYLVLADPWFPGWTCAIDGREARVYRANYVFRAVQLPAGSREVVFTFAPASYRWGKIISGGTVVAVLALSLWALAARVRGLRA